MLKLKLLKEILYLNNNKYIVFEKDTRCSKFYQT